jgi:hypothetical protein
MLTKIFETRWSELERERESVCVCPGKMVLAPRGKFDEIVAELLSVPVQTLLASTRVCGVVVVVCVCVCVCVCLSVCVRVYTRAREKRGWTIREITRDLEDPGRRAVEIFIVLAHQSRHDAGSNPTSEHVLRSFVVGAGQELDKLYGQVAEPQVEEHRHSCGGVAFERFLKQDRELKTGTVKEGSRGCVAA